MGERLTATYSECHSWFDTIKFHLTISSSQRMQLYPADFMSAAQMPKDRRQRDEALERKRSLRAWGCSQSGITELQDRRKRWDSSEMQNTAAERLQLVSRVARLETDGQKQMTVVNHVLMPPLLEDLSRTRGQSRNCVEAGLKFIPGLCAGSLLETPSPPTPSEQPGRPNSVLDGPRDVFTFNK